MNIIELENVYFTYHSAKHRSLSNINLKIKKGEVVLLTGKSGCGKTTLTRLINGLIPDFYEGELNGNALIKKVDIRKLKSFEISELAGSVFQDPRSQFFTTETASEVSFGCENMQIPRDEMNISVEHSFKSLDIENLNNRSIFSLSSGEKQKIAIASIYAMKPEIYIFDEPSANLDMRATENLAILIKRLKRMGKTIIISEHRLYYLMAIVDRIIYIKKGEILNEWTPDEVMNISNDELEKKGLRVFDLKKIELINHNINKKRDKNLLYEVEDILVYAGDKNVLNKVSFSVNSCGTGIVGIIGENGAGKTTLIKTLSGVLKSKKGKVKLNQKVLSKKERMKRSYFVMQDVDYQLFTDSVKEELLLGNKRNDILERNIKDVLSVLELTDYEDKHPMSLSGGQKQRVSIAAAAVNNADIIFFDEPTSGLDGENMRNVSNIVKKLKERGKLIFVVSHDIEFLAYTCSRILCMRNGEIIDDFLLNNSTIRRLRTLLE